MQIFFLKQNRNYENDLYVRLLTHTNRNTPKNKINATSERETEYVWHWVRRDISRHPEGAEAAVDVFNVSESEVVSVCASCSWARLRSTWPLSTVITRRPTSCWEPASAETPAPKWTEPRCTWPPPRDTRSSWSCWSGSEPLSPLLQLHLVFQLFNSVKVCQSFYLLTLNVSRSFKSDVSVCLSLVLFTNMWLKRVILVKVRNDLFFIIAVLLYVFVYFLLLRTLQARFNSDYLSERRRHQRQRHAEDDGSSLGGAARSSRRGRDPHQTRSWRARAQ